MFIFYLLPRLTFLFSSILGLIFFIIIVTFVPDLFERFIDYFKRKGNKFYNGRMGEEDVKEKLEKLSDDYIIFRGLLFNNVGDVDFTVVGPTGIFVIEVKDYSKCTIGYNGSTLTFSGQVRDKNILNQVIREATAIHDLLLQKIKLDFFINRVLVFSSYVKLSFGYNKIKNVSVIGLPYLNELITSQEVILSDEQITKAVGVLQNLVLSKY